MGTAAINTYEMTVPGGSLPTAGVTRVSVLSTHRRRGILTAMMRRQFDDVRARGEPLAALYASEAPIYGRFGYGLAIFSADLDIERARGAFARPRDLGGQCRFIDTDQALNAFMEIWERTRPHHPGMLKVPAEEWRALLSDPERHRKHASEHYRVVYEVDGSPAGFALYRIKPDMHDGDFTNTLLLEQLVAATPEAYEALWRYCLEVDLTVRVTGHNRPLEEALQFLLRDARAARMLVTDGIWLRLVDVEAALQARRYAAAGRLVFDINDPFCPWNAGRYELEAGPAGSRCRRTQANADLELEVDALAATYLGGNRYSTLQEAGRIVERTPGSIARADAMLRTDRVPWCPSHF